MEGSILTRPLAFERGDKVYLTTPLMLASPTAQQVEEYAFASAVKSQAPNEHIGWLSGRYVEAGRANLNGAMWLSDELAIKSLTPMLMPITVMHDPRTAVGTIADCKLHDGGAGTSRIDTILAVWKHRFPEVWAEAEQNIADGTMMQSMECLSPSYTCSECAQQFVKLPEGKEQASWCEHLRNNSSRRILQDVCFTGTGLIFGTRGGEGAYTEAHLDHFQDEIAEYHARAHIDGTYRSSERSAPNMALVQIDSDELATIRRERDDAKRVGDEHAQKVRDLEPKLEQAEAEVAKEKERADAAEAEKAKLEAGAQAISLKEKRIAELGQGFLSKLGEFTRGRLNEQAASLSDEEWDTALKEKEELAGVKRDTKGDKPAGGGEGAGTEGSETTAGSAFADDEVAAFARKGVTTARPQSVGGSGGAARSLARAFKPQRQAGSTETK